MEIDTAFREKLVSHPNFYLDLPSKPKLDDGFTIESTSSNRLYPKFPNVEQFTIEGSSSNPFSGAPTRFNDPFDPFQASSANRYLKDYTAHSSSPSISNGAPAFMHGFEGRGVLNFPSKTSIQTMDQDQIQPPPKFQSISKKGNSPNEVSVIIAENGDHKKNDPNKKKKREQTKRKNKGHKDSSVVKGQWTREEDRLLMQSVEQHGVQKWSHIAQMLPGRIGKQCRERWHNHLRPDIKKDTWSEEEDKILIEAHREIGNKWAEIARRLPARSENTIKNHWNATKRRLLSSRKSPKKEKYNTLLQKYIKTLISNSDSGMINPQLQVDSSDSEPKENMGAELDEKNMEFDLPMELGSQMEFDVEKEKDFLEMLYQESF